MTLADQAGITGHDGQVTKGQPERPKRRTFTAAYKAPILAAFDASPEGRPERGELLCRSGCTTPISSTDLAGLRRDDLNDWERGLFRSSLRFRCRRQQPARTGPKHAPARQRDEVFS